MKPPQKICFDQPAPFELYLPQGDGPFPLIVITPLLGRLVLFEDLYLERSFARFFARFGLASALVHRTIFEFDSSHGLEQLHSYLEQSIKRNTQTLDLLFKLKEVDPQKIGSFGMSFGGIVNLLWGTLDQRLKAHLFALVGGNLPEIFTSSRDPLMRSYLKAACENSGLGLENLKTELQKIFKLDPLETRLTVSKENVFMVLALFDRVIHIRYGLQLRRALGNPETWFLPFGHYSSILSVPLLKWKALKFFRNKFKHTR